jgi:hypothetical protein
MLAEEALGDDKARRARQHAARSSARKRKRRTRYAQRVMAKEAFSEPVFAGYAKRALNPVNVTRDVQNRTLTVPKRERRGSKQSPHAPTQRKACARTMIRTETEMRRESEDPPGITTSEKPNDIQTGFTKRTLKPHADNADAYFDARQRDARCR